MWGPRRDSELVTNDGLMLCSAIRNHTLLSELRNDGDILFVLIVQNYKCSSAYIDIRINFNCWPVLCPITKEFEVAVSSIWYKRIFLKRVMKQLKCPSTDKH